ncbi:hypothetical protein C5S31_10405 [ANME-1 cluster archaeon GoMg2]|nr:hypothetical protein [ANME-1 cluster archaeon GoMg2]
MCPPILFVTGITLDLCFRIVYLSRRGHFSLDGKYKNPWSFFSGLYDRTSVILDERTRGIISGLFEKEHVEEEYKRHVEEMTANIKTVQTNMMYVINQLGERLIRSTRRDAGFNWFIQINNFKGLDPMKTSVKIFQDTGIAILPEPCFKLNSNLEYDDNFWFRVSLAVPRDAFENNFKRFISYLDKTERR